VILLALSLGLFGALPQKVSAQTPPPSDLKFLCAQVVQETRSARCALYVPANVVGASFEIEIPKGKFSSFQNLKKGDLIPPSGLFFQLEAPDVGGSLLLRVNYADLKAQPFVSQPYALLLFDIVLSSVENTSFPLVIDTSFRANGQLYTAEAVALNQPSFKALTNLPLQLQISGAQESAPISSSFHFAGDEQTLPTVSSAPTSKCFDDPVSSMTEREWSVVCEAKTKGIINGNTSGNGTFFLPNQPVNRAEAMKIVTLGILRSLGKVNQRDFVNEERSIKSTATVNTFITYPDIGFENGEAPWFAVFVNIASQYGIVQGYPQDGTFKAGNTINNAESYRVIVETGRVASEAISKALDDATQKTSLKTEEWFLKYANTLDTYNIPFSREYEKFTTRKEFLIMVMDLLKAVGLS
jgi:hypothetical protein